MWKYLTIGTASIFSALSWAGNATSYSSSGASVASPALGKSQIAASDDSCEVCGEDHEGTHDSGQANWLSGENVSFALPFGGLSLHPHLHITGVYGTSTADEVSELAVGGHDPNRNEKWQLQGIEPGVSLRGDWLEGFATGNLFTDAEGNTEWEWEEYFLKLPQLPLGLELRGGRMLQRIGFHNANHLHAWSFVDAPLANALFLGEEGLAVEGADLTWETPGRNPGYLTFAIGEAPEHGHEEEEGHGHEDEEDHDDEHGEEEHHDEEEDEHHEEEIAFVGDVLSLAYLLPYNHNDFHRYRLSLAGIHGEDEEGEDLQVYSAGVEYNYHPEGYNAGGSSLRWRTEGFIQDHAEGEGRGVTTQLVGLIADSYEAGLRYGWVDDGEDERRRASAVLGFQPFQSDRVRFRVQYNYDDFSEGGNEHSVWFQTSINWGGPEVR